MRGGLRERLLAETDLHDLPDLEDGAGEAARHLQTAANQKRPRQEACPKRPVIAAACSGLVPSHACGAQSAAECGNCEVCVDAGCVLCHIEFCDDVGCLTCAALHSEGERKVVLRMTTSLHVDGICCPAEVPLIQRLLEPLPGVTSVSVNVPAKQTRVVHDCRTSPQQLVLALNDGGGLDARIETPADAGVSCAGPSHNRWPKWNVLLSGAMLGLSFLHYASARPGLEPLHYLQYAAVAAIVFTLPSVGVKALKSLRQGVININTLMLLAVLGALGIQRLEEAASVLFLFSLSDWLESRASERARLAISAIIALRPEQAELKQGGTVAVEEVKVGSILVVRAGQRIPVDGCVVRGVSWLDESSLTGESRPQSKTVGDDVSGGTLNLSGYLEVRATAVAEDSAVARLVRLVQDAQMLRSPTEQLVDRCAAVYTPMVVIAALLMASLPWAFVPPAEAESVLYKALVLLVVACPCALVISTPITYVCALANAAGKGILVKGGVHLEALAGVSTLALDKTGTLTHGVFVLTHLSLLLPDRYPRARVLGLLAAVEKLSSHPLADALCHAAASEGAVIDEDAEDFKTIEGSGLSARVGGLVVGVGNIRLAASLAGDAFSAGALSDAREQAHRWENEGGTVGWLVVDGEAVAVWCVADRVRDEARYVVSMLDSMGVGLMMLTGDNAGAAAHVGAQIGLRPDQIHAQLLPHDKLSRLHQLTGLGAHVAGDADPEQGKRPGRRTGHGGCCGLVGACVCVASRDKVGMVGDGVNDAPALAAAHIGLAMGAAGSAVAMETADVVLMDSNLKKLPLAITLGRATLSKIRQNMAIAIVTKIVMIGLTAADMSSLWLAIVSDVGAMLLVTLNGMTLLSASTRRPDHPDVPWRQGTCAAAVAASAAEADELRAERDVRQRHTADMSLASAAASAAQLPPAAVSEASEAQEAVPAAASSDTGTQGKTARLNTEQQDAVDAFMESTGLDDVHAACACLRDSGWQLHRALMAFRKSQAKEVKQAAMPAAPAPKPPKPASAKAGGCCSSKGS